MRVCTENSVLQINLKWLNRGTIRGKTCTPISNGAIIYGVTENYKRSIDND